MTASLALPLELRRLDRIRAAVRRKAAVRALYRAAWRGRHPVLARVARLAAGAAPAVRL